MIKYKYLGCLSHGGGMDSTALLFEIAIQFVHEGVHLKVHHINYGQLASDYERRAIQRQIDYLVQNKVKGHITLQTHDVDMDFPKNSQLFTGDHNQSAEVPDRNGKIIEYLAGIGESIIYVGADPLAPGAAIVTDRVRSYFDAKQVELGVTVITPFLENVTHEMYQDYLHCMFKHEEPYMDLVMTCWTPVGSPNNENIKDMHCGKCEHCVKMKYIKSLTVDCVKGIYQ